MTALAGVAVLASFALVLLARFVSWGAVSASTTLQVSGARYMVTTTDTFTARSAGWYGSAMLGLGVVGLAAGAAMLATCLARKSAPPGFLRLVAGAAGWGGLAVLVLAGFSGTAWLWRDLDLTQKWPLGQTLTALGFFFGAVLGNSNPLKRQARPPGAAWSRPVR